MKSQYKAVFVGTPVAGTSITLRGAAGRIVNIDAIEFSQSNSNGIITNITLEKITALTGGTPVSMTPVPLNSIYSPASALPQRWTVAPIPTSLGRIKGAVYRTGDASNNGTNPMQQRFDFSNAFIYGASSLVLNGTNEWVGINFSAVGAAANAIVVIDWIEIDID